MSQEQLLYYSDGTDVRGPATIETIGIEAVAAGMDLDTLMIIPPNETEWRPFAEIKTESTSIKPPRVVTIDTGIKRHLLRQGDHTLGPFDDTELECMAADLPEDTEARQAGVAGWMPLAQYLQYVMEGGATVLAPTASASVIPPASVSSVAPPPPIITRLSESGRKKIAEIAANPYVLGAKDRASVSASLARLFISRIVKSDFTLVRATEEERQRLAQSGDCTTSALAQDYAAWRRAVMVIALALLSVATLHNLPDLWEVLSESAPFMFKLWYLAFFATQVVALMLLGLSVIGWTRMAGSRLLGWAAWCLQFFGPMLLLLVPLRTLGVPKDLAAVMGITFTLALLAKIFGLFSGLVRSALTLKTLLPQGRFAAWVVGAVAPFSALFFGLAALFAVQTGATSLAYGFIAFTVGALMPLAHAAEMAKPCDEISASQLVTRARRSQSGAMLAGLVFLGWYALKVMEIDLTFMGLLRFVCGFLANLLMVTLAAADLIIGLTKKSVEQTRQAEGTASSIELEQRLNALR